MGSSKTPELASLVLAMPVFTAAMLRPAWLVKLNCFISPARRYLNSFLRKRPISSILMAAASRPLTNRGDRVSTRQSLHPQTHEPSHQEFDRGRLGRSHFESWLQFVDVEKSEHNPFKNADDSAHSDLAKLLIGLGSRTERCPTPWCLTPASAGVKSICFLRNLVV